MGLSFSNPTMVSHLRVHTHVTLLGTTVTRVTQLGGYWEGEAIYRPLHIGPAQVTSISMPVLGWYSTRATSATTVIDAVLSAPAWTTMDDKIDAFQTYCSRRGMSSKEFAYFVEAARHLSHNDFAILSRALVLPA